MEELQSDIRKGNRFIDVKELHVYNFHFEMKKNDGNEMLIVHADNDWWNCQAEIIFHHVLFHNCPEALIFCVKECRLATEEEESYLRTLHDFPESYGVYCFETAAGSLLWRGRPVERDVLGRIRDPKVAKRLSLHDPQKSFVIAESVTIVAFSSDRLFGKELDHWQKGELADMSEEFQETFQKAIETSRDWAKQVEERKRAEQAGGQGSASLSTPERKGQWIKRILSRGKPPFPR